MKSLTERIIENRKILRNPYAYLGGNGTYEAVDSAAEKIKAEKISDSRRKLEDPYAYLNGKGSYDAIIDDVDNLNSFVFSEEQLELIRPDLSKKYLSDEEIEQVTIKLQRLLWKEYSSVIKDPIKLLDPSIAFNALDYNYNLKSTLGQFSSGKNTYEVAGLIDSDSKCVQISRQFSNDVQKFTFAHELGHALLHESETRGLHRDKAIDGSESTSKKDSIEYQAEKFAVFFLMPEKLLRRKFKEMFLTECFVLNESTIFALDPSATNEIEKNCRSLRDLSRLLAKTESYNGSNFYSLSHQFGVSTEAMAIRLEELELCEI